jgi:hypothetical protein
MRVLRNILRERIGSDDMRAECDVTDVDRMGQDGCASWAPTDPEED